MCEKIDGYKDFCAHHRVSLDPSLRGGFYFVYDIGPPSHFLTKRVTRVIIFYSLTNHKAELPRNRRF